MFYGHTHWNEFNLHFNKDRHPFAISYLVGGTTPETEKNPSFNIYTLDGQHAETSHVSLTTVPLVP